ncbi:hypothetical protein ACQR18_27265, partial [Bradyrhizobium oligotrophicum]|uniref:hypothetical protein n=1 Tax=Bradyrhizobium oligotrophicum TaxID=44255 RepID=UPI003EC0A148
RFDERGGETGRCRMAQATAPFLDSTRKTVAQGRPDIGLNLWFCRVLLVARGPRVSADTRSSLRLFFGRRGSSKSTTRGGDRREMTQPYPLFETYSTRPGDAPHQVDSRKVIRGLSDGAGKLLFGKSTMAMSG